MKRISLGILMIVIPGCIHIHRKASIAPPEVAEHIQFPEWDKDTATVTGPQLKALQIAMDDFRPAGWGPSKSKDALVRCLQQLENYDAWIKRGEKVTFVHFTPKEDERCGLEPSSADVGASYAISDEGIILRRE